MCNCLLHISYVQSVDLHHPQIFLRKLAPHNDPGTNLKSACLASHSSLALTQAISVPLFCLRKLADSLPKARELRVTPSCKYACVNFVKREGVALWFRDTAKVYFARIQTRNMQLPSLANNSLACEHRTNGRLYVQTKSAKVGA